MENSLVDDIKARLPVDEVIGSYIDLKRAGTSYKALSPFKAEKTPSLVVTPSKNMWKDFSSGKGGDIFKFVMEYEGVEFKEALNILAQKAGLDPQAYRRQPSAEAQRYLELRKKILHLLEQTTIFYEEAYAKSKIVQNYVQERGFSEQIIKDFRIGYSPKGWGTLTKHFVRLKIPMRDLSAAGLVKKRQVPEWVAAKENIKSPEQWSDFFWDRLMIPLSDPQGSTIGFTSRLLKDVEGVAKYVNTKQTFLYNKSKHVFGYFQAKDAIRQAGFALVVEGNLDVVACHQAGYKQTVAAGGTALTVDHLKIIGRLTKDIRLAFDGDSAGTMAMERSMKSASEAKINLSIVSLPADLDPDDLIKKDLKLWEKLVGQAQPAPEWLYERYKSDLNLDTAAGKRELTDVMLPIINQLPDEIEKDHYLQKLEKDNISRKSLEKKLHSFQKDNPPNPNVGSDANINSELVEDMITNWQESESSKINLLLGLLLVEPQLRQMKEGNAGRLLRILENHHEERDLYMFLQQTQEIIDNEAELKQARHLQDFKDCVKIALNIIRGADKGRYWDSDLKSRQEAFDGLFRDLDIQQTKKEAIAKLSK